MFKKLFVFSLALGALSIYIQFRGKEGKTVETRSGALKGLLSKSRDGRDFYEWLGVPYAEPPLGELRFASPKPIKRWEGVREANWYGSRCAQVDMATNVGVGSEDCLTLNIHVPKVDGNKKLPVMLYIHGGGFNFMGSFDYRPHYFMDEAVVLVTINYRLGPFGFMSTGDTSIRGNMGLKDQRQALIWVKENIEYFGGDPEQITIFGESAGGASVHWQMLTSTTKGLFQRAISLSGVATQPWSYEKSSSLLERTKAFSGSLGCPTGDSKKLAECMRSKTTAELLDAYSNAYDGIHLIYPYRYEKWFHPMVEVVNDSDAFITEHPMELMKQGRMSRVPWMTGVVADEGIVSAAGYITYPDTMNITESNWHESAMHTFGIPSDIPGAKEITKKIRQYYFPSTEMDTSSKIEQYVKLHGDSTFNFHMSNTISIQREFAPVYAYHLSRGGGPTVATLVRHLHRLTGRWPITRALIAISITISVVIENFLFGSPPADLGVCHADDLPLLFWIPFAMKFSKSEVSDTRFSKDLVGLFAAFAKNERMEFRGTEFQPVRAKGPIKYLDLGETSNMIDEPFKDRLDFLRSLKFLDMRYW